MLIGDLRFPKQKQRSNGMGGGARRGGERGTCNWGVKTINQNLKFFNYIIVHIPCKSGEKFYIQSVVIC